MSSVHLIILIHGLYGSPANLAVVKEELLAAASTNDEELVVHVTQSFTGSHTWDGIDVNAWRASQEVDAEIARLEGEGKTVERFSIMGYSLGGLVARYLVGLLHARSPSFFTLHQPTSFSTAATPHIGVLKYGSTTNTIVHTVGRRLFSRSGQQLYALDKDWDGRSILEVMADPNQIFLQALQLFPNIQIVANGCHDLTVPYPTAMFSLSDPFDAFEETGLQVDVDENHVVRSWHLPDQPPSRSTVARKDGHTMIRRRPRFPPIFFLPFPFTYVLVLLLPFIVPLWLLFVSCVMTLHTIQSRRRHRIHGSLLEKPYLAISEPDPDGDFDTYDPSEPLLSSPTGSRLRELRPSSPSSGGIGESSGTETPPLVEFDIPDAKQAPGQIPLLLTPSQKRMCRNLEANLPQINRIIAWFPWAFNAHALLVARDARRFKRNEEGRHVVRAWVRAIMESTG